MLQKIDFKRVGRRIHDARERMGMTQQRLSDEVDCESRHISAIETGVRRPSIDMLAKISEALDTSVDYFLMDAPHISRKYFIDSEIKASMTIINVRPEIKGILQITGLLMLLNVREA